VVKAQRVLFVQYTHPAGYPPIERAARILESKGWGVRIVGIGGLGTDALAANSLDGLDVRLVSGAGRGILQKLQYLRFLILCARHALVWRPTWLYVSDSFASPIGLVAAILGGRVVYHEHDSPTAVSPSRVLRIILRARRALLRRAHVVVSPNEERSAALSEAGRGRQVLTAWNCTRLSEVQELRVTRTNRTSIRLVYHGSIVPAKAPLTILDAIARADGVVELIIAGYETIGSQGYVAEIKHRASELGISDKVNVMPAMPRAALLERAASCDIGLSLVPSASRDPNERRMAGASNKAFEYLACGVPLIVSDLDDWRRLFVDRGVAWACEPENVNSIVKLFNRARQRRHELIEMGQRGQELVRSEWNYETQFAPVLQAMNAALPTTAQ
jgi:glycosyltransferase involved in cell wall biosynthesis